MDDRVENVSHTNNFQNSIVIKGFEPFGHEKTRAPMTNTLFCNAINDNALMEIIHICKNVVKYIKGCSMYEISDAIDTEYIFQENKLGKKKLQHFIKMFGNNNSIPLITVGNIDMELQSHKGGKMKSTRKRHGKKKRKSMKRRK